MMTMVRLCLSALIVLLSICFEPTEGAKILVYPIDFGFNSRLMNMVKMADILNENGHNASVLLNTKINKLLKTKTTNFLLYDIPDEDNVQFITDEAVLEQIKRFSLLNISSIVDFWVSLGMPFCERIVGTDVVHRLKAEQYDLIITDAMSDCGKIMIDYLHIPSMIYSNWGFLIDPFHFYPALPSFVCTAASTVCSSDTMTFQERLANLFQMVVFSYYTIPKVVGIYDKFKVKHGMNSSLSLIDSTSRYSAVIVNGDFVLDYPRPLMPHVIMISGMYHKPPNPLPDDLRAFVEGSAPHGIVVVSFGSLVPKISADKAEIFAKVFARLPQRVLWRYNGAPLNGQGSNTKLVGWFPQPDVLSNPLMRLFVTHCGISGTYEAALNGIPVIAIPMFADQEYNAQKLTGRAKMGLKVDIETMTERSFQEAVLQVLSNETFAANAKRVSQLLHDQETPARSKFLYWIDYVIRNKGVEHLISKRALSMGNIEFFSADIIFAVSVVTIGFISCIFVFIRALVKCVHVFARRDKLKQV